MSRPNITTLPPELHLKIGSYLRDVDSIALSLASKKLYAAYSCHLQFKSPARNFWNMISVGSAHGFDVQQQMLNEWDMRLELLPRLRYWTQRVMGATAPRGLQYGQADVIDYDTTCELCVGCACYKVATDDWKEGWNFYDVVDGNVTFEDWAGIRWSILHNRIEEGSFCKSCCQEWDDLRDSWDVGIYSS